MFGPAFSDELLATEPGQWNGPLNSAYGAHLVMVQEVTGGGTPKLDDVSESVRREWLAQRRAESKQEFFQALLRKYNVVVEELDATDSDTSPESGT